MADEGKEALSQKSQAQIAREAKARLKRLDPNVAAGLVNDVTRPVSGFVTFLRERAVVGLAIGFVFGSQAQSIVKGFTDAFIAPLLNILLPAQGTKTFDQRTFTLNFSGRHGDFKWGELVYALIEFLLIAFVVYIVVKLFKLDKLDKK